MPWSGWPVVPSAAHQVRSTSSPQQIGTISSTSSIATVVTLNNAATQTYPLQPSHEPFRRILTPPECISYTEGQRIRRALAAQGRRNGHLHGIGGSHPDLPPLFVPIQSGHGTGPSWPAVAMNPIEERDETIMAQSEKTPWADWFRTLRLRIMSAVWRLMKFLRPSQPVDARFGGVPEPERRGSGGQDRDQRSVWGQRESYGSTVSSELPSQVDADTQTEADVIVVL